jgi:hypothetical protein
MPGDALMLLGTNTPTTDQIVGTDYSSLYQRLRQGAFLTMRRSPSSRALTRKTIRSRTMNRAGKRLPSLGITFPVENIRGRVNTARILLSDSASVKRLYFGIPLGGRFLD